MVGVVLLLDDTGTTANKKVEIENNRREMGMKNKRMESCIYCGHTLIDDQIETALKLGPFFFCPTCQKKILRNIAKEWHVEEAMEEAITATEK